MSCSDIEFKDFVILQRGFDLPVSKMKEGDVPVLGSNCIVGYHNESKVDLPGVVTGRSGTLGLVQYTESPFWPHNTALWVKDFKGNYPKFVYYMLQTLHLERFNGGASVPTLNRNVLDTLKLRIPKYDVQHKIASVLSVYDDLIENNNRRIKLLEESARLLYQEWFVRLRFPGHEHTRIVEGVPEGWTIQKVGALLMKFKKKKRIPKEHYISEGRIPCVDQSTDFIGGFTDDEEFVQTDPLPIIVFGDHTRSLKFIDFPFASGADGTQLIYPNCVDLSSEYFYFALKAIDLSNFFYARHFKFLKAKEIVLPNASLMREFTFFAHSCFEEIRNLRQQNQKLKAARDLLLPRLMSGEIAV